MKTIFDFLMLSPSNMGKYLRSIGIQKYADIEQDCIFHERLNLEPDPRVLYVSLIRRGSKLEVYSRLKFVYGINNIVFEPELKFIISGKCSVFVYQLSGQNDSTTIWEKECSLFDKRPNHNNLSISIPAEYYCEYQKNDESRNKRFVFPPKKAIQTNIDLALNWLNYFDQVIPDLGKIFFNGMFKQAYDKYNSGGMEEGNSILLIYFHETFMARFAVAMLKYHNHKFLSYDLLSAGFAYAVKLFSGKDMKDEEIRNNFTDIDWFFYDIFYFQEKFHLIKELTVDQIFKYLQIAAEKTGIDTDKKPWSEVCSEINNSLEEVFQEKALELAEKYDISLNDIGKLGVYGSTKSVPKEYEHLYS